MDAIQKYVHIHRTRRGNNRFVGKSDTLMTADFFSVFFFNLKTIVQSNCLSSSVAYLNTIQYFLKNLSFFISQTIKYRLELLYTLIF